MGALDPNDSLDEIKSGHSDLLGRFSDDQVMRNVRRVAKQLSKKGLCKFLHCATCCAIKLTLL